MKGCALQAAAARLRAVWPTSKIQAAGAPKAKKAREPTEKRIDMANGANVIFSEPRRILVIRRDNIGDLVCTTPLFAALRQRFPSAHIALLTNTYAEPVVHDNPDLNAIHVYEKGKHAKAWRRPAAYWRRAQMLMALRRTRFDCTILAAASYYYRGIKLARWVGAPTIGFAGDHGEREGVDHALARPTRPIHEVEDLFQLLAPLGIDGPIPPLTFAVDPELLRRAQAALIKEGLKPIGLHISAREQENRWAPENFIELIRQGASRGLSFALFWSPGTTKTAEHPGYDEVARHILSATSGLPVVGYRTAGIPELAAGLACCQRVVGSDGGHVHVAAAVGTPVLGLYCDYKVVHWRPWGENHKVLSARRVGDIPVAEVLQGLLS